MATFSARFLGCKVSFADVQAIRERLLADGHREIEGGADVAVVNTCCVTHEAVSKSRQAVSRASRTHGRVYVTGCAANLEGAFTQSAANVTVVSARSEMLPDAVARDVGAIGCVRAEARLERTRAFVKIQDGCSFSCAFCVIPLVRGATRSRRADAVLAEIRKRVFQGHPEIVLTGVNLGCFRDREAGYTLAGLVREAGAIPGVERLRLSSIEVNHLTGELIEALRETPAVSAHLHVPVQSGDDDVLRAMGRRYSAAQFLAKLAPLSDFNLTSDVIVGFPGEDEQAFERTLEVVDTGGDHQGARVSVLTPPGNRHRGGGHRAGAREEGSERSAARSLRRALPQSLGDEARNDGSRARRPARDAATGTTTRRGSWTRTSVGWCGRERWRCRRRASLPSQREDCLFCRLVAEGDHVASADGFVAIRDINPLSETHLLVLPERHIDTFKDIDAFPDDEAGRMLRFVAETARSVGLDDYRVLVNVGAGAGQTIFHLHWHVLGGRVDAGRVATALAGVT